MSIKALDNKRVLFDGGVCVATYGPEYFGGGCSHEAPVFLTERDVRPVTPADILSSSSPADDFPLDGSGGLGSNPAQHSQSEEMRKLKEENERLRSRLDKKNFRASLRSTVGTLLVVSACAVLVSTLAFPLLKITGTSMAPTLLPDEYVVATRYAAFETGDLVAFYSNNKILVKRVIATAGSWVDIAENGAVNVDGSDLQEPYLSSQAYGHVDIALPYQVPDGALFVMGDNRSVSLDSRTRAVGCVYEEQIVGKVSAKVWPPSAWGMLQAHATGK